MSIFSAVWDEVSVPSSSVSASSSSSSVPSVSSYSYLSSNSETNLVFPDLFWDFFGFRDSLVSFRGTWVFNFVDFGSVLVGWILGPGLEHDVSASIILVHMFEFGITSPPIINSFLSFKNMESFWMSLSQMHLALYFRLSGIISNTEFRMLDFLLLNCLPSLWKSSSVSCLASSEIDLGPYSYFSSVWGPSILSRDTLYGISL